MSSGIAELVALGAAPATNDLLVLVDVSDTTQSPQGSTKSMTMVNALTNPPLSGTIPGVLPTINGGTVTASTPVINAIQTWNAGGSSFFGIYLNITDTASGANSYPLVLAVGGTPQCSVRKDGFVLSNAGANFSGTVTVIGLTVSILGSGGGAVSAGAPNSGGAGFRQMLVPN